MFDIYKLIVVILCLFLFNCYRKYKNNLWEKLGIFYLPSLPIFGNDMRFLLGLETNIDSQARKYRCTGKNKYAGTYMFGLPFLFVKDPEIIECILIKDFTYFYDRGLPVNEKVDPLQAHLFNLAGKRWKHLRQKISPVFTSGKLKTMHHQLIDCADVLMNILDNYSQTGKSCDFKELIAKFTTDVIGSCAYGINMQAMIDESSKFRLMGKRIFETTFEVKLRAVIRQILRAIHPQLLTWLNIKALPKDVDDFFLNLIKDTIELRETNPSYVRNDFVQLLTNLKKEDDLDYEKMGHQLEDNVVLDYKVMAANAFIFFIAGFETTSSTITYCLFELSKNQKLQDRVYEELISVLSQHDGEPTYDAVKEIPLLDMVVSETFRKYPPAPFLVRMSTEAYRLPDCDVVIPKGTRVEIPVYSLHHDPEIYPQPEEFIPERFSPNNIDQIPKGAYLPFGDGPRICIGARFAQMEIKVALAKILYKYRVNKCDKMADKLEFEPKSLFLMVSKGGIWLNIEKR